MAIDVALIGSGQQNRLNPKSITSKRNSAGLSFRHYFKDHLD
jgi:hypothetical protein